MSVHTAWIHWDPNPVLFILPWVNKPVVWYGVLFALGFYCAYVLMLHLTERYFYSVTSFTRADVQDWDLFREDICYKREGYIILSELSKSTKNDLLNERVWTDEMKDEVISALNSTFREGELYVRGVQKRELSLADQYAEKRNEVVHRLSLERQFLGVFFSFKERAKKFVDSLFTYVFLGTLIGARLGHLFFYRSPKDYLSDPYQFIAVWEGGLASHGAVIGIIVSLLLFMAKERSYSLLRLIDFICAPVALCAVFIRIGNFCNQEIIGIPTSVPWAIIFGHPMDGGAVLPRHPVQLYEAITYFVVLMVLMGGWKNRWFLKEGRLAGLFFMGVFGSRFFLEFFKETLGVWDGTLSLMTGQLLSIPIAIVGCLLLFWKRKERKRFL